jgi:hypothetical protein
MVLRLLSSSVYNSLATVRIRGTVELVGDKPLLTASTTVPYPQSALPSWDTRDIRNSSGTGRVDPIYKVLDSDDRFGDGIVNPLGFHELRLRVDHFVVDQALLGRNTRLVRTSVTKST